MNSEKAVLLLAASLCGSGVWAAEPAETGGRKPANPVAQAVLTSSGIGAGLCVHVGCADGVLTAGLTGQGAFVVHGLDRDTQRIQNARQNIQALGLYGLASVERHAFDRLPYADNLINLLVVHDAADVLKAGLDLKEVFRVLTPNGVAFIGQAVGPAGPFLEGDLEQQLAGAGFVEVTVVREKGAWCKAKKPQPADMDEWTHARHGPDGNRVCKDAQLGLPEALRWIADPTWGRHHNLTGFQPAAMVSAQGRLFYVFDEAPVGVAGPARATLIARDAYNGLLLWKRPLDPKYGYAKAEGQRRFNPGALVAAGERVFCTLQVDGPLVALAAASGELLATYPDGPTGEVLLERGTLLLASSKAIQALDAKSATLRWKKEPGGSNPVLGEGRLFCQQGKELVSLDLATGEECWRRSLAPWSPSAALCFYQAGILVCSSPKAVLAFSAQDGKPLWTFGYTAPVCSQADTFFSGGLVWVQVRGLPGEADRWASLGLDPASGAVQKRIAFPDAYPRYPNHPRCYPSRATERYGLLSVQMLDLVDWQAGKVHDLRVARGACGFGILPCNGLLYAPPHHCICGMSDQVRGFLALAPASAPAGGPAAAEGERLEKGPAYPLQPGPAEGVDPNRDWPTYRHDPQRSGHAPAQAPANLRLLWETRLGKPLTAPVICGDLAYVAAPGAHRVWALEAQTGQERWSFVAGGPVDSPPTIHAGLALFGCHDGWVYALQAKDGALAWRFRAAPQERRMVAFGQVESPWPVPGSVLVRDGTAYFAAGRGSGLDGGIHVYALAAETGKLLWHEQARGPVRNDLLVAVGPQVRLQGNLFEAHSGRACSLGASGGLQADAGLLEPSCPSRSIWSDERARGELLVFDEKRERTYGVVAFGERFDYSGRKNAIVNPGSGSYTLFCVEEGSRFRALHQGTQKLWSTQAPLRPTALLLAGETLFVAGVPDLSDPQDPWAALEGRRGGQLHSFSAAEGLQLQQLPLAGPPVFDGLAAAAGRLYLATQDGRLQCYDAESQPPTKGNP